MLNNSSNRTSRGSSSSSSSSQGAGAVGAGDGCSSSGNGNHHTGASPPPPPLTTTTTTPISTNQLDSSFSNETENNQNHNFRRRHHNNNHHHHNHHHSHNHQQHHQTNHNQLNTNVNNLNSLVSSIPFQINQQQQQPQPQQQQSTSTEMTLSPSNSNTNLSAINNINYPQLSSSSSLPNQSFNLIDSFNNTRINLNNSNSATNNNNNNYNNNSNNNLNNLNNTHLASNSTNSPQLSYEFKEEQDICIQYFDKWSPIEQTEFVENLIRRMCHFQHGHINNFLKPMLQRDFISSLPAKGLISIAEMILSYLDAKSLCAAELVCKEWTRVISEGMLWKKLIERQVSIDPMWKGLSQHRGWAKYLFKNSLQFNQTAPISEQHRFYKDLYVKIIKDKEVS